MTPVTKDVGLEHPVNQERKAYNVNTDSFTEALAELIRVYQTETPGMEYRCKCHDGTIVTIRSGKPPKTRRKSVTIAALRFTPAPTHFAKTDGTIVSAKAPKCRREQGQRGRRK